MPRSILARLKAARFGEMTTPGTIVGVDFGAPKRARDQRRKIIAIAAQSTGWRSYRIDSSGLNARLIQHRLPGWTAQELGEELLARPVRVIGFDFPFSIPLPLLRDPNFAAAVGHKGAFRRLAGLQLVGRAAPASSAPR